MDKPIDAAWLMPCAEHLAWPVGCRWRETGAQVQVPSPTYYGLQVGPGAWAGAEPGFVARVVAGSGAGAGAGEGQNKGQRQG